jgi:predicted phage terminase large subunit-like protein
MYVLYHTSHAFVNYNLFILTTISLQTKAQAEIERRKRQRATTTDPRIVAARNSILGFTQYTMPEYDTNWHHRTLCERLDALVRGDITRLMVFMPPRHGKSELVSRRFPAYILGHDPNAHIIACSYGADLASRMNRDVQRIIDAPEYGQVFPKTRLYGSNVRTIARGSWLRNSDIFEVVEYQGVYRSAGVGGGITGMGFTYGIIDDPIKNREEADSETIREKIWEWFTSTFYTRQHRDARILITLTRWHEDDLGGRLLELAANDPKADQWSVLRLPAVADEDQPTDDDPRTMGDPLWPDRFGLDMLGKIQATDHRQWEALYQQRPRALAGDYFKRAWFEIVPAIPVNCTFVRYWDLASGESENNDRTIGVLMARDPGGYFYIVDVVRGRWNAKDRNSTILQTAALDHQKHGHVETHIEQAPGLSKEPTDDLVRQLAGYAVYADRVTKDKESRAQPLQAQCQAGNVKIVYADWNRPWLDVMCDFPTGKHDDDVDATSGAFNKLAIAVTVQEDDDPFNGYRG